ncbi:hypothetical protein LCGC14_1675870 [marine sediment metagenome]|uniref:Uncharacterized protein n=1 Tax=marine sediment metagenome TaxID=412755 RepID=A0A0F9HQR0_9ZZZZ
MSERKLAAERIKQIKTALFNTPVPPGFYWLERTAREALVDLEVLEAEVERLRGVIKKAHRMLDAGSPTMACDDELCPHDPENCAYAYLRDEIEAQAALDKPNG